MSVNFRCLIITLALCVFAIAQLNVPNSPAYYCNPATKTCVVWPQASDDAGARPTIADILGGISPEGWNIVITSCTDTCSAPNLDNPPARPCNVKPTSCSGPRNSLLSADTVYIDVPNVMITHDNGANSPMTVQIDANTWASQAAANETYPCTAFVITTYNVSIINFRFDTDACTANLQSWFAVAGQPSSLFWIMSTPVIVMADNAMHSTLRSLSFYNTAAQTNRSDAIVRIIPETPGTIINLDGAVFSSVIGRPDYASPIFMHATPTAASIGVVIGTYSGAITTNSGTRAVTLRTGAPYGTSVGDWFGSTYISSGVLQEPCPVCKTDKELHRTNTIYIIVGSVVGGAVIIGVSVAIFVHVRNRRKAEQKAAIAKSE